jgi:hypothetical protein
MTVHKGIKNGLKIFFKQMFLRLQNMLQMCIDGEPSLYLVQPEDSSTLQYVGEVYDA